MKFKEIFITTIICLFVICLYMLNIVANKYILRAENVYKVYLNGEVIGFISDDKELYSLINDRQKEIMKKYNVKNVYPSENFQIVNTNTYNVSISSAEEIYNKIAELESFTIEGYIISIKDEEKTKTTINVLNKEIFDKAIYNFLYTFLPEEDYKNYIAGTQAEIETTGKIINTMYFDETITIKKGYVDISLPIYKDENELTKFLLFGDGYKIQNYKVKEGDTIASVSEANKLNTSEFLIANPNYSSKDSLLKIGDNVNVTRINPVLTFTYEVTDVSDVEVPYQRIVEYDDTKEYGYSVVTTPGVTGISRMTYQYVIKNGETQAGVIPIGDPIVIVAKVDEVTTRGKQSYSGNQGSGSYVDTGDIWGWPTNTPYVLTSYFDWRWGVFHEGIDISGTGYGSPIYAALDGEVVASGNGGMVGWQAGWNVVIKHDNGYYTVYAHMVPGSPLVSVGERVSRGQRIGSMGQSGVATGTHLHFGLYQGVPYQGGKAINPLSLW